MQHRCPLRFLGFPLEDARTVADRDECEPARKFPTGMAWHLFSAASALQPFTSARTDSYLTIVNSIIKTNSDIVD